MTKPNLDALEKKALAATPGPWNDTGEHGVTQTTHITRDVWHIPRTVADVAFIAEADPQTILALVAELRHARKLLASKILSVQVDDAEQPETD